MEAAIHKTKKETTRTNVFSDAEFGILRRNHRQHNSTHIFVERFSHSVDLLFIQPNALIDFFEFFGFHQLASRVMVGQLNLGVFDQLLKLGSSSLVVINHILTLQ
jgi:hypothetical protein